MNFNTNINIYTMTLSEGFAVYVPHLVLDKDAMTIVAMQMIGPEQAVNANWAAIVNGGAVNSIYYTTIKLSGMKQHFRIKGTLPCGWTENWIVHNQVSIIKMDVGQDFFYVLNSRDDTKETLISRFFVMLDKSLPTPMVPEWRQYLWDKGIDNNLIAEVDPYNCINLGAWKVERNTERWEQLVSTGLSAGDLSFI